MYIVNDLENKEQIICETLEEVREVFERHYANMQIAYDEMPLEIFHYGEKKLPSELGLEEEC